MKEFYSRDGGRYTFVDDVLNLQELALAITGIFHDCNNFVVWGCNLNGNSVSEGLVYLNGKLRHFNGGTCQADANGNRYLVELNSTELVPYASGDSKDGRINYSVTLSNTSLNQGDVAAQYIIIKADGSCTRLKDAFFGLYTMLLNPASNMQAVNGQTTFRDLITAQSGIQSNAPIEITSSTGTAKLYFEDGAFKIESIVSNGSAYSICFSEARGLEIYSGASKLMTISRQGTATFKALSVSTAVWGDLGIKEGSLYNSTASNDEGALDLNMCGYNGTYDYYRTTRIGNGRGQEMVTINGKANTISLSAWSFTVQTSAPAGLILLGNTTKDDITYTKTIAWRDSKDQTMGYIGYTSDKTYAIQLKNEIGALQINALDYVDITPAIKEGGELLSDKYVQKTAFQEAMNKKADGANVYNKEDADGRFANLERGFTQFTAHTTSEELRSAIDAVGTSDLGNYAEISQCLADMAQTEEQKTAICKNIGAAKASEYQPKLKDTGWKRIGTTNLYARQIGDMVSIQGSIMAVHEGVQFTLPNDIEPPRYSVSYTDPWWIGCIAGGKRDCTVVRCSSHGREIPLTITYFT